MPTIGRNQKQATRKRTEPNIKDAVRVAINYLKRVMGVKKVLLEEIEETEDGVYWLITLSHEILTKDKRKRTFSDYVTIPVDRSYRVIKISKETGLVSSMKIREI